MQYLAAVVLRVQFRIEANNRGEAFEKVSNAKAYAVALPNFSSVGVDWVDVRDVDEAL